MAQRYYPVLWDESRINQLFMAGKITAEEYKQITGQDPKEKAAP